MSPNPNEEKEGPVNAAILEDRQQPKHRCSKKPDPEAAANVPDPEAAAEAATVQKIRELPKDIGVMLVAVGVAGIVLPGMMGSPAIVAGGLVLWPKAFGRVETWFERRFPKVHREGMRQIDRYLNDLDRRYSYSANHPTDSESNSGGDPSREPRSEES